MSQCRIRALVCEGHARAGSSGALQDTACTHSPPRCLAMLHRSRSNTKTHKQVLLRKYCHGYSRNKGRLQGKKSPSAPGEIRLLLSCLGCVATHALGVSVAAAWDGWLCPWHDLGLGQVPDPLVGHKVQEKDLQGLFSRLRQGQTHRHPGQTGTKAREKGKLFIKVMDLPFPSPP